MGVSQFNYHPYKAMSYNKKGFLSPVFTTQIKKGHKIMKKCMLVMELFIGIKQNVFLKKNIQAIILLI